MASALMYGIYGVYNSMKTRYLVITCIIVIALALVIIPHYRYFVSESIESKATHHSFLNKLLERTNRVECISDTISFTDLENRGFYVFSSSGLKYYNNSNLYGLFGAVSREYPGYRVGSISLRKPYTRIVLIYDMNYTGISDYALNIVLINKETGVKKRYPLLHNRPTVIEINMTSGEYGEYDIYFYGWICVVDDSVVINYSIDYRVYSRP